MSSTFVLHKKHPGRELVLKTVHAYLDRLPETHSYEVIVGLYRKPRTTKQRKALFAAAYAPIMDSMGLRGESDKKDLHAFWCGEYWGWHAELRNKPLRTTTRNQYGERDEISTVEALNFYEFIQQRSAERGIFVPDPDPFWREAAHKESLDALTKHGVNLETA